MSVTSSQNVRVVVDGVEWVPISRVDNVSNYSLTCGGRVLIFNENALVFSFLNEYKADFTFTNNLLAFAGTGVSKSANGRYVQANYPADFESLRVGITVKPDALEEVADLSSRTNQEGCVASKTMQANNVFVSATPIDVTKPLEIYLGNVLLAYITP